MSDVTEELARLAKLRDDGVLTEAEFEAQKSQVLSRNSSGPVIGAKAGGGKGKLGKGCLIVLAILVVLMVIGIVAGSQKSAVVPPGGEAAETGEAKGPSLTMAGFNRVKSGMTFDQVTAIIGQPSQEMSRTAIGGTETVMYMWEGHLGANMNATFQDGKLVQKAQFGLQ